MKRLVKGVLPLLLLVAAPVGANVDAMRTTEQTVAIHRYAFTAAGPKPDEVAAERCGPDRVASVQRHLTPGDVAAAIFTSGWFTPQHATYTCLPPSTNP